MKRNYQTLILFLTVLFQFSCDQKVKQKNVLLKNQDLTLYEQLKGIDLSRIILTDSICDDGFEKFKRAEILGYIDSNYQRFQIHFTNILKDEKNPYLYIVFGKTKVKKNICDFKGTFEVTSAEFDTTDYLEDIGFKNNKNYFLGIKVNMLVR